MTTLINNRINRLLISTGVIVAIVILSMAATSGIRLQNKQSVNTPVPFGSTMQELILKRPVAGLLSDN
ncbi:MAG: hypothetical protein WBB45_00225 [Cyclobacteriaceae bacterium]